MTASARLSVCMIARDEAEILSSALESVRGLADEVIVVDTGSVDGTAALAQAHGARVALIPWNDDFAAARNASLDLARGDWVLILDADEVIEEADHAAIRRAVAGAPAAYLFTQRNYVADSVYAGWSANDGRCPRSATWPGFVTATQIRLLPNSPALRYRGAVHEDLSASVAAAGIPVHGIDAPIHHFGKVRHEAVMARKQELYTRLGEQKLGTNPSDAQALYELGAQYLELDRWDESLELFRRCLDADPLPYLEARAASFLGGVLADRGQFAESLEVLESALGRNPTSLHLHETRGRVLLAAGRYSAAIDALDLATRLFPDQMHLRRVRAGLHIELRRFAAARTELEAIAAQVGDDPHVRRSLWFVRTMESGHAVDADSPHPRDHAEDAAWVAKALASADRTDLAWDTLDRLPADRRPFLVALRARLDEHAPEPWGSLSLRRGVRRHLAWGSDLASVARRVVGRGDLATGTWLAEVGAAGGDPVCQVLRAAIWNRVGCAAWASRSTATLPFREPAVPAVR